MVEQTNESGVVTAGIASVTSETIVLVIAVIATLAAAVSAVIAAWQGVLMKRSERNRTQPIVVVYERAEPDQSDKIRSFLEYGS